ncbi:hypothetical protein FSP39_020175 [Pinctada imbricata]|uniref:EGF-like domain-containing protein n=1 Tax=Pinctada imbricata TaxID=66713 RepID=A0AA89C2H9_PINIB|nr:hypothetical protein FSP39_020175 [Pinctada imbricata]
MNVNAQHRNIKHKGLHINQRDQWATGADLGRSSATEIAEDIDECANDPCQNNGSCTDLVNAYECSCAPGFNGTDCESDIDECANDPCQNNGSCTDLVNAYECSCAPGFNGTDCESVILNKRDVAMGTLPLFLSEFNSPPHWWTDSL